MIDLNLNVLQGYRTSYIVNAKTAKGESVLKLDRDQDGQVPADEAVLVTRESSQSQEWKPVKDVAELKSFLEKTPSKERGQNLGLWRDRRWLGIGKRDGVVQSKEVWAMAGQRQDQSQWTLRGGIPAQPHADTVWSQEHFHHMDQDKQPEYKVPESTAYYYTKIDPARVEVGTQDTPAGPVATFKEGQVVTHTHVEKVTCFAQDGGNWVPMGFKDSDYYGAYD